MSWRQSGCSVGGQSMHIRGKFECSVAERLGIGMKRFGARCRSSKDASALCVLRHCCRGRQIGQQAQSMAADEPHSGAASSAAIY